MRKLFAWRDNVYAFVRNHGQHLPAAALIVGAIWDFLTLGRPDSLFANITLGAYLFIAGGGIIVLALRARHGKKEGQMLLIALIQFSFGNLASALLVLYSQSSTLVGNWPFLLIVGAFLIGNEFIRGRYALVQFQLVSYYLLVALYMPLILPILVKSVGDGIFFASGGLGLAFIALYGAILYSVAPAELRDPAGWKRAGIRIFVIYLVFNFLYAANLIPPVPLSLKEIGAYNMIVRAPADKMPAIYEVRREANKKWYDPRRYFDDVRLHLKEGEKAYCFSAVFAPDDLSVPVYHRYEHYDEGTERWISGEAISFPIRGGRDEGYRGYTAGMASPGKWRCSVETERGALIGRTSFIVEQAEGEVELVSQFK